MLVKWTVSAKRNTPDEQGGIWYTVSLPFYSIDEAVCELLRNLYAYPDWTNVRITRIDPIEGE